MRSLALSTILALCEQNQISTADLEMLPHQLAQHYLRWALANQVLDEDQKFTMQHYLED
ncbi:hypothetical protein [uncultured Pantoea sp.]|uniref:hypothetical protein n=1 Tax=uncultured Pantoea sp. TaxID=218084 RepID=UPI00258E801D|nr:hypothetical protein [uncultured Pantoea sp.]